jgi:parallel beta-helix repeat protein
MSQQVAGPGPASRRRFRIPALLAIGAIGILPAAFLANPSIAEAAPLVFYVDKTMRACSDAGPGTAARPFCTVTKGVSRTTAGYTLYIGWGNFAETIRPIASGTAARPIRITAWPGRSPIIGSGATNGALISGLGYISLSNLKFSGTVADGIVVSNSTHITVTNNTVSGAGRPTSGQIAPGVSVRGTTASIVSYNNVHHNNGHGIVLASGTTGTIVWRNWTSYNAEGWQRHANGINVTAPGNFVLRNITHNNEDSGIQFYAGGDNNLAASNLTYNNGDHGIDNLNVTGGRLISNTVYRNCTSGINVEGTSSNYQVVNNIAVDNAVYPAYKGISCNRRGGNIGIWDSAPSSTTVNHNLVWLTKSGAMYAFGTTYTSLAAMRAARGQDKEARGVQADPRFVRTASWNLRLLAGSPAIDRGHSGVSGAQSSDLVGNARVDVRSVPNSYAQGPRRYDDLGAFEFRS